MINNFINKLTKRRILLISLVCTLIFPLAFFRDFERWVCQKSDICFGIYNYFYISVIFFVSVFVPVLITFLLKQSTFESWRKFTFTYYFIIYLLVALFLPWDSIDNFFPIEKDIVALFLAILYNVVSVFFIIYKSLKKQI